MTTTSGSAKWQGGIKDGKGAISTKSGALKDYPYGFASRFEGKPGSNPEELIGAAHAACFTMALSLILGEAKLTAEQMETKADVTLEKVGDGFSITSVHLTLNAKVPGADNAKLQELAGMAKAGCPVSKLFNTKITLDAYAASHRAVADLKKAGELPPHLAWLGSAKLAALTNVSEDLTLATRDALIRIIDWMVENKGLSREQAYVLASVAVDLRIGQLVDVPNFVVTAVLPLDVFED